MATGQGVVHSYVMEEIMMGKIIDYIKMKSFRSIITITLIVVVAVISFSAFHIYSHMLENRIQTGSYDHNAFRLTAGLIFTISMVLIIVIFVLFIHYRFVRRSLKDFNIAINYVNQGNLQTRLSIPETKELGKLGKSFNEMLDTFQRAQLELEDFHKKELRSNYKLATIGEMSARLAHEIRNPVTGIANAIEIIIKENKDKELEPVLEEIRRQANRVNDDISDLLKYSKKTDVNLSFNNINEIIDPVIFFLENQAVKKNIEFKLELDEQIPSSSFDIEQMEDVLLNLGMNAIQSIRDKGEIKFETKYRGADSRIIIEVSDNGSGIDKKDLFSIFHPFFTTKSEGTGLGLAIVKDTIEKHNGEIRAENIITGGAKFSIELPVVRD